MISSACLRLRRSANGDGGNASSDGISSDRSRPSSATITVSRTVSPPNPRAFWNARPMPRRARRYDGHAVDALAEHLDVARRLHEPGDGVHERGLARAVGADEADDLAGAHLDRRRRRRRSARRIARGRRRRPSGEGGGSRSAAPASRLESCATRRLARAARGGFQSRASRDEREQDVASGRVDDRDQSRPGSRAAGSACRRRSRTAAAAGCPRTRSGMPMITIVPSTAPVTDVSPPTTETASTRSDSSGTK